MGNQALRAALVAAGMGEADVAEALHVDIRTVQRWLAGRVPYRIHRRALMGILNREAHQLWPGLPASGAAVSGDGELVALYPHRSDVPRELWWALLSSAQTEIALLVYAALFLPEQHLGLITLLRDKGKGGCRVRIALGDSRSPQLLERGDEEEFGEGIASRARLALRHYWPLRGTDNISVHVHATTLYASIFRADDDMLVNTHVWGTNAFASPVLHLRRIANGGVFDLYAGSFESVWAGSTPTHLSPMEGAE